MQLAPAEERLQQQIVELEAGSATPPRQRKQSLSPPKPTDDGDGLDIPDCLRRTPILPANDAAIVPDEVPQHGGNGNGGAPLSIDAPPVSVEKTAA